MMKIQNMFQQAIIIEKLSTGLLAYAHKLISMSLRVSKGCINMK